MKVQYQSLLGCIDYFDPITYCSKTCEQTLLFVLGLESILTEYNPLKQGLITIPKYVSVDDNEVELELFDRIYNYLEAAGKPNQKPVIRDNSIEFPCNGLKVFLNWFTGTDNHRIVPIIFHDYRDINILHLTPQELDDYDLLAEKIYSIFSNAGYSANKNNLKIYSQYGVTDKNIEKAIKEYNDNIFEEHFKKCNYSQIYKIIDYKAMYAYSLGVLYGCKVLGYADDNVFRLDPSTWYNGEYTNLVTTAQTVFKFHYTHPIPVIDSDPALFRKYRGIQCNKLWNFDNSEFNFKRDEVSCKSLKIEHGSVSETPITYSKMTGNPPGSYLLNGTAEWKQLDNSVLCDNPKTGIVANDSKDIVRYIANDEVHLNKAYLYCSKKNKYLSPNSNDLYFMYTANIGWVNFKEDSFKSYSTDNPVLTLNKLGFDNISSDNLKLARNIHSNEVSVYYKCHITDTDDRRSIYGILPGDVVFEGGIIVVPDDATFSEVLSDIDFNNLYEFPVEPDNYTLTPYYNLDKPISIYVYNEDDSFMWNGHEEPIPIVNYGYTLTPSALLETYKDTDHGDPIPYDLRYNTDERYGYWSNEWQEKEWRKEFVDETVFLRNGHTHLYKNIQEIIANIPAYTDMDDGVHEPYYVFNNYSIPEISHLKYGFVPIYGDYPDTIYSLGITSYPCDVVYKDDFGNSLLDEDGNPLVWYDQYNNKYWNGLFNLDKWQEFKPSKLSAVAYDSLTHELKNVYDLRDDHKIFIDNDFITYNDFYMHHNNGIIRQTLYVFKEDESDMPSMCYYDSYDHRYCIPGITQLWVYKESITALGYEFVDGITMLYKGSNPVEVVYDSDESD
jgi:hypothetical protein